MPLISTERIRPCSGLTKAQRSSMPREIGKRLLYGAVAFAMASAFTAGIIYAILNTN